jgi:hypothetical protein
MSTSTFLQTLKSEVARMQAAHPERADEISRANALIMLGMVTPTDDPTTALVLSSDGTKHYEVNGTCSCTAGAHGKACKHMHSWKLYQHVLKKMAPTAPTPTPAPLPEARASLNFRAMIGGYETQITLRSDTEEDLLERLQALLKRSDLNPVPKPQPKGNWKPKQYQGR